MERASRLLRDRLSAGDASLAQAGFEALGEAVWSWPGFSRDSLRAIERCDSAGGGACLALWRRFADEVGALPFALGRSGHAQGQALAALGEAPFWAAQNSESAARELGSLLSLCVRHASDSEAGGCVRTALGAWLMPAKGAKALSALRLASETVAFELAGHPLWLCPAGDGRESAAFSLLERAGFSRAAPVLLMALGERCFLSLRSLVDGRGVAHLASAGLDEGGWRLAMESPELFSTTAELGQLPSEALAAWLDRLGGSDAPRAARQLASARRMLLTALALERDFPGSGFGADFVDGLSPASRALCEWSELGGDSPDPILPARTARAL